MDLSWEPESNTVNRSQSEHLVDRKTKVVITPPPRWFSVPKLCVWGSAMCVCEWEYVGSVWVNKWVLVCVCVGACVCTVGGGHCVMERCGSLYADFTWAALHVHVRYYTIQLPPPPHQWPYIRGGGPLTWLHQLPKRTGRHLTVRLNVKVQISSLIPRTFLSPEVEKRNWMNRADSGIRWDSNPWFFKH